MNILRGSPNISVEIESRYATRAVYEMRRLLRDAQASGQDVNDIEYFVFELPRDKNFLSLVADQYGSIDSYSLMSGYYHLYSRRGFRNKRKLQALSSDYSFSSIHAFISIKEWNARNYFLCVAHAFDALQAEAFERREDDEETKAIGTSLWVQHVRSQLAKQAAEARHKGSTYKIREKAIELYKAGTYPSAHRASIEIADQVRAYSKELGRPLSRDRSQKTIYDWLRSYDKDKVR